MSKVDSGSGVYKIEHVPSGRVYIGSAVNIRRRLHIHRCDLRLNRHHSSKLQRAWDKYGEAEFACTVLLQCDKTELLANEQRFLDSMSAVLTGFNCNPTAGSWLGRKHSPEARAKLSALKTGVPHGVGHTVSSETRAKIGAANRGRQRTDETRAKLRAARIGKKPSLGMVHTEAARQRMSLARKGRHLSPEHIEKSRLGRVGIKFSPEARENMRKGCIGRKPNRLGIKHSAETRNKMRERKLSYWRLKKSMFFIDPTLKEAASNA